MHRHIIAIILGLAGAVGVFMGTAALALSLAEPVTGNEQGYPQGSGIIVALGWLVFIVVWQSTRRRYTTFAKSFGITGFVLLTVQLLDLFDIGF
ncbi:MAG: hypothetical protein IPJ88_04040 [Myxococcales bacterium]|nr:MAG: hypothetical protein IPJ88_04040 [Myxococcales bacterium]